MHEWKIRQKIYHQIFQESGFGDDLFKAEIIENWNPDSIVLKAVNYPVEQDKVLYYPAKSYAVAIIFSKLLEKHFNVNFFEVLNDPQLLYGNDPYFKIYSEKQEVYDKILAQFPWEIFEYSNKASLDCKKTIEYFYKEFLLHEDTKIFAPS